jgi:hypothetical protein
VLALRGQLVKEELLDLRMARSGSSSRPARPEGRVLGSSRLQHLQVALTRPAFFPLD